MTFPIYNPTTGLHEELLIDDILPPIAPDTDNQYTANRATTTILP